jgi:hypothetical protein
MRWVVFRTALRMAFRVARLPLVSTPKSETVAFDPSGPWPFEIDGMEMHGWRTPDWTAIVPAPGFDLFAEPKVH